MIPNFPLAGSIAELSAVFGLLLVGVDILFRDPSSRFLLQSHLSVLLWQIAAAKRKESEP
jgi:hypothetical protein